jgi:DNA-binding PucR family transcriptional regulator
MGGEQVQSALPSWTGDFVAANERAKGKLLATLRAYGESDMNVLKAARLLDVHPNTVYARMDRIEEVTGLDGQRFDALNELLLAAELGGQLR